MSNDKQLLEQPEQEPDWLDKEKLETDWDHVWLLINAATYASSRGHMSCTTNWGVAMSAYLRHETNAAAQPAPVQESVAWEHHAKNLTQWLHCMSYNDSYFGEPAGLVKQVTAELNRLIGATPPAAPVLHTDDLAVDRFADAMKAKMAKQRAKGYGGWDSPDKCPTERLQTMLADHLGKGDPVDVGNFAMMLWNRGGSTAAQRKWVGLTDEEIEREWQFLHDEEGNQPDHHDFARAIEAAHGITEKGGAA